MLVLSRRVRERVVIRVPGWPDIVVSVGDVDRGKVRLAFSAPAAVLIHREELLRPGNTGTEPRGAV